MKALSNIEKSAFRPAEYVGYANGVWRIRRSGLGWTARRQDRQGPLITARTLEIMSQELQKIAEGAP